MRTTSSARLRRRARTTFLVGAAVAALVALPAASASAHVHVTPSTTASGSYAELVFKVPNEKPAASTTKVVVTLPQDRPLTSVSVKPVPGWTATVTQDPLPTPVTVDGTTLTKAPHLVTWTASSGGAIAPGQYQTFAISAGPLPAPGQLLLPVAQTYSDGSVVEWADPQAAGAPEPEHPAPSLEVTAAVAGGGDGDSPAAPAEAASATTPTSGSSGSGDALARWLSGAALVVALGAVGLQLTRRRRDEVAA